MKGRFHVWYLGLLLFTLSLPVVGVPDGARILVIHSYTQEYPWTRRQHRGFMDELLAAGHSDLLVETEHLDTKRRAYTPRYATEFAGFLRSKYEGFSPHLIYVSDDNALTFALTHMGRLFPGVPVFFSGVNDLSVGDRLRGRAVSGVFEKKEIVPNLELLAAMGRRSSNFVVIGDASVTYRAIEHEIRNELESRPGVTARFVASERIDEILTALQQYRDHDLFLTTLGAVHDNDGRTLSLSETIGRIVSTNPGVVISMEDVYLLDGVLGGYVTSGVLQGASAARLAHEFLVSGVLQPLITDSPNEYIVDARQLVANGLTLPAEIADQVKLINQPPSLYERYRTWVLAAPVLLLVLLTISLATFLLLLSRKNRLIAQSSAEFEHLAEVARLSTDRMNEAQRLARQGTWVLDTETGFFSPSDGLSCLCGTPTDEEDADLASFLERLPPEDAKMLSAAIVAACDKGEIPPMLTHGLRCADGSFITVRETIKAVFDQGGRTERLIGSVQDVSEQFLAEQRLHESEDKYRRLFELSEDPMWLIVGNRFVMANEAARRTMGYETMAGMLDTHPSRVSPELQPDGRPSMEKAEEFIEKAYATGYQRFEWTHVKKDGTEFPVEVSLTKVPYEGEQALFCIWRDITDMKAIQGALEDKSIYLDGMLRASEKVAIVATDAEGCIQYYNPAAEVVFGMPAERALGVDLRDIHRTQAIEDQGNLQGLELAREQGEYRFTMNMTRPDGMHHVDARISPIFRENEQFAGYMLMCEDVTKQRRAAELIAYQASYDPLTDLPNRRLFVDRLDQALARARRHGHMGAVLFFDLDNFKNINDALGHPVGDEILRLVAMRIMTAIRDEDTVARLGGDEFVVLLTELSEDSEEAVTDVQMLAEKIRLQIGEPYSIESHELHVSASIGIALFPYDDESPDVILRQADTAMYRAKESGRDAVRFFLPSMQLAADQRLKTLNELRRALPRSEFRLFFQPQFDVQGNLYSAEALLRWQHPEQGLKMPGDFIALAEESGLIAEIGEWVLHEALSQLRNWQVSLPGAGLNRIAVNVSALQFRQADFVHRVETALGETGAAPESLTLEMTESILLADFDETIEKIQALKKLGVRFSLDDFGTGYSSLAYLKRLPVDELKIDRSFVRDVLKDANDAALVETIMTMARHIGLEVVAEGVESAEVMRYLIERGCPLFQGYHLGKPCSVEDFTADLLSGGTESPKHRDRVPRAV